MKSEKGFTLVELLITVAVMMILGAMAILYTPNMLASYRVKGATRLMYSDMQMSRLKAIKEGKEMAVEFVSATAYCIKMKTTGAVNWDAGCDIGVEDTTDIVIKTVDLSGEYSGVSMTLRPTRDIFYPNGKGGYEGAASGTVTLSKDSRSQSLIITTGTGRIRIQ